jgi:NAD-dependent SIR2 family protein deacetylase
MLIGTGAGMGVASNLGTFRGKAAGVWPPLEKRGIDFTTMSCPDRFRASDQFGPRFAWSFWSFRYRAYSEATPHRGYSMLTKWADEHCESAFSFTSNIDGHWRSSGFDEESVYEVHGSVHFLQCQRRQRDCSHFNRYWPVGTECAETVKSFELDVDDCVVGELPTCPGCGDVARPNVLMFGDGYVLDERLDEQAANWRRWQYNATSDDDDGELSSPVVIVEIGAGRAVPTVRYECERLALKLGSRATLIRINPEFPQRDSSSPRDAFNFISLQCGALDALEKIEACM